MHAGQVPTVAYRPSLYFHKLQNYPSYEIIKSQEVRLATREPINISTESPVGAATTTSTVVPPTSHATETEPSTISSITNSAKTPLEISTGNTIYSPDEFPHDLLEIAHSKLGLKSLDEVPSISELAELFGTANLTQTVKYIRQMTNTAHGIALMKTYLESADFTDRTDEQRRRQQQQQKSEHEKNGAAMAETKKNFLERIAAYFHIYNLWPQNGSTDAAETLKRVEQQLSKYIKPRLEYRKRMQATAAHQAASNMVHHKPLLVRNPLPYHYPIPLRPISGNRLTHNDAIVLPMPPDVFSPVHLNTPRFYVPPSQQLQTLLQTKPKLAQLAAKVSRLPLTNDRSTLTDTQLLAVVKHSIEQDDDLRKLLQTTAATLK